MYKEYITSSSYKFDLSSDTLSVVRNVPKHNLCEKLPCPMNTLVIWWENLSTDNPDINPMKHWAEACYPHVSL